MLTYLIFSPAAGDGCGLHHIQRGLRPHLHHNQQGALVRISTQKYLQYLSTFCAGAVDGGGHLWVRVGLRAEHRPHPHPHHRHEVVPPQVSRYS